MNNNSPQKTNITKPEEPKLKFTDSKAVFEHLEYLGYSIERHDEPINDVAYARSTNKPTIIVTISQEWIQLLARYTGYEPASLKDVGFLQVLNQTNKTTGFSTWFAAEDNDDKSILLSIYAAYRCYDKMSFGNFISTYEQEINTKLPGFAPWYKASD